ncbi:GNAT family N-acetyltransferase [Robiginitalea sp. IMCC44478]|uniref:GNAT family N-acetyltransferase n=1 Tax=Robiginitalea sp. IMCC44478 TaxID=3459122 RepID=UPI004042B4A5
MKFISIIRRNFHLDFYEEGKVCFAFKNFEGIPAEYFKDFEINQANKNAIIVINCIPPYLLPDGVALKSEYASCSKNFRLGYAMQLTKCRNATEFLRQQLGKKVYKNLRQDKQRLEKEHDPYIKIYHGEIDRLKCENLLSQFKRLIEARFGNDAERHYALKRWSLYEKNVYQQIQNKSASLVVVYSDDKVAGMSLNYHFKNLLTVALNSYDQDFAPYSMGRLMFWYILDWCYKNNILLIDLEWGNLPYKVRMANVVFKYQTLVVFPRKNIFKRVISFGILNLIALKYTVQTRKEFGYKNPEHLFKHRWMNIDEIRSEVL